jgi:hypothetical protein
MAEPYNPHLTDPHFPAPESKSKIQSSDNDRIRHSTVSHYHGANTQVGFIHGYKEGNVKFKFKIDTNTAAKPTISPTH